MEGNCTPVNEYDQANPAPDEPCLCSRCEGLAQWISECAMAPNNVLEDEGYKLGWLQEQIFQNSSRCTFCELLTRSVQTQSLWEVDSVKLLRAYIARDQKSTICAIVIDFESQVIRSMTNRVHFPVYCSNPLSGLSCVRTTPPLQSADSPETFSLIKSWMTRCSSEHADCKKKKDGSIVDEGYPPLLPKRVIDVSSAPKGYISLVSSLGLRAKYCALSHCWGSADNGPLKATKITLESWNTHKVNPQPNNGIIAEIPIEELPKTFRDAVKVTRGIGIRYLWIDSLCILQDDPVDWEEQAQSMGSLYETAHLTIAASSSTDSTGGLFMFHRPSVKPMRLPLYGKDRRQTTSIQTFPPLMSAELRRPEIGPLYKRGWAYQERMLSRRMVFFCSGGIQWRCNTVSVDEVDCDVRDANKKKNWEWGSVLFYYSFTSLTFETDRLIALQGLVNEVQKTRHEKYFSGIWEADLPGGLLWYFPAYFREHPAGIGSMEGDPRLPSWTWASKPGIKELMGTGTLLHDSHRPAAKASFIDANIIQLRGNVGTANVSSPQHQLLEFTGDDVTPSQALLIGGVHCVSGYVNGRHRLVGVAAMDDCIHTCQSYSRVYCLFLTSKVRQDDEPSLREGSVNKGTGIEGSGVELDCLDSVDIGDSDVEVKERVEEIIRSHLLPEGSQYHMAIILRRVDPEKNTFQRIGIGAFWATAWSQTMCPEQTIYLV